ncbi:hypothetical protein Tsubulata_005622, partial [Turnera subulata]
MPQLTQIHAHIIRTHLLLAPNASPFHWNNLIRSYARLDSPSKACRVYLSMSRSGVLPDCYTLPIVLKAASHIFALGFARQLHSLAFKIGLQSHQFSETGFIAIYAKAGEFQNALQVFDENPDRKLGSWNALLSGLCQGGRAEEVIRTFFRMMGCGRFYPDGMTMVSVTSACGSLGDLGLALQLHKHVFHAHTQENPDIVLLNSLIDMYGKCGRMDLACKVFSKMDQKNVSSWTSMIVAFAMHGRVRDAIDCFACMREAGVRPNHVTFVGVLSACVHGGLVEEGRFFFDMMANGYRLFPRLEHYGCMVDLLGRVGLLEEARKIMEGMPMKPNVVIWGCLMSACEKYANVGMGEWVAKHLIELEPWNDGVYVVLSNIYASRGLWREVQNVRGIMKQQNLAKIPAYSLATSFRCASSQPRSDFSLAMRSNNKCSKSGKIFGAEERRQNDGVWFRLQKQKAEARDKKLQGYIEGGFRQKKGK